MQGHSQRIPPSTFYRVTREDSFHARLNQFGRRWMKLLGYCCGRANTQSVVDGAASVISGVKGRHATFKVPPPVVIATNCLPLALNVIGKALGTLSNRLLQTD